MDWYGLWLLWVVMPVLGRVPLSRVRDHSRVLAMRDRAKRTAKDRADARAAASKHAVARHRHRDMCAFSPPLPSPALSWGRGYGGRE